MNLYQKTNLLSDSTKDFGDKIGEKTKLYSHTAEAFSPILAKKTKLNRKQQNSSRELFFGIVFVVKNLRILLLVFHFFIFSIDNFFRIVV
jgi:hypothetical protein